MAIARTIDGLNTAAIRAESDVELLEQYDGTRSEFIRSLFTYFDSEDAVWVGQSSLGKKELKLHDITNELHRMPDEAAFPKVHEDITRASDIDTQTCFVKRPQVYHLLDKHVAPLVPKMLLDEVRMLENLKMNPHPNIVPYYGCIVKRGHITGIALKRYSSTLDHRFLNDTSDFDVDAFEHGLRAAVRHIHSIGLAHNDINPSNIALDENDRPVLIDWGSCKEFGAALVSAGTPGWTDDDFDVSRQEHDVSAMEKVIDWVKQQTAR